MKKSSFAALVLAALALGGALNAQASNDTWEPNNNASAASTMVIPHQIGQDTRYGFVQVSWGTGGTKRQYEDLALLNGDEDWFAVQVPTITPAVTGISVYMNQTGGGAFPLLFDIRDAAGTTVLAGATPGGAGTYVPMSTGSGDPYDGARATAAVTGGVTYRIRVFHTGTPAIPSGTAVPYRLSVEYNTATADASEGNFSNNYPQYSPAPGVTPGDASPAAQPGTVTLASRIYAGFDYYRVTLASPGKITATINTLAPFVATDNFDIYWINSAFGQSAISTAATPTTAVPGASDSWSGGTAGGLKQVTTPNTSETLTTPALPAGTYYFQVTCFDTSTGFKISFYGGTYTLAITTTLEADDAKEGTAPNENDMPDAAASLSTGVTTSNLKLLYDPAGNEVDWYKINVADGQNLEVEMTITTPAQDNLQLMLYKPAPSGAPKGDAADLIDISAINNPDSLLEKGISTPLVTTREIVGTWGAVGASGTTGYPAGEYLLRVSAGNLMPGGGGYSLNVSVAGTRVVAPEDAMEPNDNFTEASDATNNNCRIAKGLTTDLKAMDFIDEYKILLNKNDNIEVTLIYDADSKTDLDLLLIDLNGYAILTQSRTVETTANSKVVLTGTVGASYTGATPSPASGEFYIAVQRWASRGAKYSLNINVNTQNPLSTLEVTSITLSPGTMPLPGTTSTQATVRVTNTSTTTPVSLATLALKLTLSTGADVTSEYTVTGPTPALPQSIAASGFQDFVFTITANSTPAWPTNGTVLVSASGTQTGGAKILGSTVTGSYTVTGGVAAGPNLIYQSITVGGNLKPGGVANVVANVKNIGTLGGTYNMPASITFAQGATDVTANFTAASTPSAPVLPQLIGAGQTLKVTFTFSIGATTPLGTTTVTISGGIADNPTTPGSGNFVVKSPFSVKGGGGGGGCAAGATTPWMPALLAAAVPALALLRRRRKDAR